MLGLRELLVLALAGLILIVRYLRTKKNLPPGPRGLPIVGNLFQLSDRPHLKLFEWAEQNGKLFSLQLGPQMTVVVNDVKLAKEMFFDSDFSARPHVPVFELFLNRSGIIFAHWIRHIRPGVYKEILDVANSILEFVKETVTDHWNTHEEGCSRDFVDEYIAEIKITTDLNSSFYKKAGRKNLIGLLVDLLLAGAETTSNTFIWSICYLTHFPDIQKKVQEELDSVLGQRPVNLSDRALLPYTEAVILETLRYSSIAATGLQHSSVVDKVVQGYDIPKGTTILPNIYYIHHDPKIWGDPENFRPERFLSEDGRKVVKNENFIPFQLGRRQCLGESLAKDSLFLFCSTTFQKFQITKVEKGMPQPENSLFLSPQPYHFIFKSRE